MKQPGSTILPSLQFLIRVWGIS